VTRYRIATSGDLGPGQVARIVIGETALCLAHVEGLGYFAVDDRCTHEDTELSDGDLDGVEIECPLHGSRFDVTTGAVRGLPAVMPARTHTIEIEGTDIFVVLEPPRP
jgi:3-phenylpropionate/trans-cinnamate dioxygenase ferredoxin subunit